MRITCKRCGQTTDALAQPPIPTALGSQIQRSTCQACWREWLRAQVIVINEYRLNLMDPEARKALEGQMRSFLNLASDHPE
jgi:Fe-S cluster biosynthesis and repair protein YggX